ncbi:MAG: ribosomal RNA small subunit methyltransferase A [Clostridiales bacterium]|nr:ribosomal RNA small subunit methyltransferase A [Clostridiales bacterium]
MREIASRAAVRRLARKYNFKPSKKFGQNFLTDSETVEKIVEACGAGNEDLVVEIGPGLGVLSVPMLERCGKLVAIELDDKLIPILKESLGAVKTESLAAESTGSFGPKSENSHEAPTKFKIIHGDILKVNLSEIIEQESLLPGGSGAEVRQAKSVKLIGNLPYFITTPILKKLAACFDSFESATIMVQKEVAEKIAAKAGAKNYAAISVVMQYRFETEHITDVPSEFFLPEPKVESSVIKLVSRREPPARVADESIFFEVVKAGFAQRRKTLLNALKGLGGADKQKLEEALSAAGIDPSARAETLGIFEFAELSNQLV